MDFWCATPELEAERKRLARRVVHLTPSLREKVWGKTKLAPWFPYAQAPIGEAWYLADRELPILVKLIFAAERLSVQVHPDDGEDGPRAGPQLAVGHDVSDLDPLGQQVIAHQPPVAAPEQPLGAHVGRPLPPGQPQQSPDGLVEFRGRHVVGLVAEALVPQAEGPGTRPGTLAASAQCFEPAVLDARLG